MKAIVREFLASLRERDELDCILPDMLSELGFTVYSRPGRGTVQYGVDVGAVGPGKDGRDTVYLLSIKQGDLDRATWNGDSAQAVRPSLEEIRDAYIPTRLPSQYRELPIVICVCLGGEVREQVQTQVENYYENNKTDKVSYETWNGDRLAGLLMSGVLGEGVILDDLRSHFRKAIALVDEPEVCFQHFRALVKGLHAKAGEDVKDQLAAARQMYVALWVLYVWARDAENLEAAYLCSEQVTLHTWDMRRHHLENNTKAVRALDAVFNQSLQLYSIITAQLVEKFEAHADTLHGLSTAVNSQSPVDVSLKLFDMIGRVSLLGLWKAWSGAIADAPLKEKFNQDRQKLTNTVYQAIGSNPALLLPLNEDQAIDVSLALLLMGHDPDAYPEICGWLTQLSQRWHASVLMNTSYPCVFGEYSMLLDHPAERSEEYLKEATAGSVLLPLIASWLEGLGLPEPLSVLHQLHRDELPHCTLQLWIPEEGSEDAIYVGETDTGSVISGLKVPDLEKNDQYSLLQELQTAAASANAFDDLSCIQTGLWPVFLMSCRANRIPVPPQMWLPMLVRDKKEEVQETSESN